MSRRLQLAILLVLLLAIAGASYRAIARWRDFQRAEDTCAATQARDWNAALRASSGALGPSVSGLRAADCRCVALVETGRRAECETLLDRLLSDPRSGDWLPRPALTTLMVAARQTQGKMDAALQLAQRGVERYGDFYPLLVLETSLRLRLQEPGPALDAMAVRIPHAGAEASRLRILLAAEAGSRGDYERTLALTGDEALSGEQERQWYELRGTALARLGRRRQLAHLVDRWAKTNPALAHGFYGWILSTTQQGDFAGRSTSDLMREAVEAGDRLQDEDLLKRIWIRYIGDLTVNGHLQEALRAYDQAAARFGSVGPLDRADLVRTVRARDQPGVREGDATGRIELRIDEPRPGMTVLVSAPSAAPHDEPYGALPVPPDGIVSVSRSLDAWPVHWVLRDGSDAVRGSGVVWPEGEGVARMAIVPRRALAAEKPQPLSQRPAAGRHRLFVVILDCGDWRFIRHGIARRELPTFEALVATGQRAVLSSVPAYTAIAIRTIVEPGARGVDGVIGVLHQLGDEAAGLNFIGRNPLAPLSWVLPDSTNLFVTLGSGDLRTANLLHSFGGLQVGRNGQLTGPRGALSTVPLVARRDLRPPERQLLGEPGEGPSDLLSEMAADFDNLERLAAPGGPDLVVIRVASLDLLTHGNYPEVVRPGQDDGAPLLYHVYRYIDRRLDELYRTLDGNDVLVVMSDHGIRTALQHDPQALFIAAGVGVPPGRLPGQPEIRGVGRMIADFFAVPTSWPATGIEAWVRTGAPSTATAASGGLGAAAAPGGAPTP